VNRSLEVRRSEHARRAREAKAAVEHANAFTETPAQLIDRVDEALASLPDELRIAVTEHFLCGRKQGEIAAALGVNQSTVQRRIQSGLESLRRKLKEDDPDFSAVALPMLLQEFSREPVSEGLRQSLIKIGLSGVREMGSAPIIAASLGGKYLVVAAVAALLFGAAGYFASQHLFFGGPAGASGSGVFLTADQLPSPVRKTLDASIGGGQLGEIERKNDGNRVVYDIDVKLSGTVYEFRIAEDGTLIWKKP
jgi:hypothetical protein